MTHLPETDGPELTHEAEQRLRSDVRRDAARAREADNYDARKGTERAAEATEAQTDATRHHDAF